MAKRVPLNGRFTIAIAPPTAEGVAALARDGFRSAVNPRRPGEPGQALSPARSAPAEGLAADEAAARACQAGLQVTTSDLEPLV